MKVFLSSLRTHICEFGAGYEKLYFIEKMGI